jgi:hypothetical protein
VLGELELSGQGVYQYASGQIQFTGSVMLHGRVTELEPLLKLLGNDLGNGKRPLTINSRFQITEL